MEEKDVTEKIITSFVLLIASISLIVYGIKTRAEPLSVYSDAKIEEVEDLYAPQKMVFKSGTTRNRVDLEEGDPVSSKYCRNGEWYDGEKQYTIDACDMECPQTGAEKNVWIPRSGASLAAKCPNDKYKNVCRCKLSYQMEKQTFTTVLDIDSVASCSESYPVGSTLPIRREKDNVRLGTKYEFTDILSVSAILLGVVLGSFGILKIFRSGQSHKPDAKHENTKTTPHLANLLWI